MPARRKHGPGPKNGEMTIREMRFIKAYFEGKTLVESYLAVFPKTRRDYAYVRAYQLRNRLEKLGLFKQLMEEAGIGLPVLAKKLEELLNAKTTKFFQKDGVVTDEREVSDNGTQISAARLAVEVNGLIIEQKKIDMQVSEKPHWTDELRRSQSAETTTEENLDADDPTPAGGDPLAAR